MEFIGQLSFLLLMTTLAMYGARKLQVPIVVGPLAVGLILGGGGLNWIQDSEMLQGFSEIGVICLLFLAGIESDLTLLKKYTRPAMHVALLGIIFPFLFGGLGLITWGYDSRNALFVGLVFAATSVSISVEVLKELRMIQTKEGAVILGASVVDDLVVVLLVSLSLPFFQGGDLQWKEGLVHLLLQGGYVCSSLVLIRWLVPQLVQWLQRRGDDFLLMTAAFIFCFGMAYLAEFVGLSAVIGAFLAGLAVGQTKVKKALFHKIDTVSSSLFVPIFFVSIGLNLSFNHIVEQSMLIGSLFILAIFSKLFGGYMGSRIVGFTKNEAWLIGSGMISRGEMALILLQIGQQEKVLAADLYSPLIIVIVGTTFLAPFFLKYFAKKRGTA